ncbi:MAG: hypothetical protein U0232_15700 [Thermomicrobiales bacterium]
MARAWVIRAGEVVFAGGPGAARMPALWATATMSVAMAVAVRWLPVIW